MNIYHLNEKIPIKWKKYFYLVQKYLIFFLLIISFIQNFKIIHVSPLLNKIEGDDYIVKEYKVCLNKK